MHGYNRWALAEQRIHKRVKLLPPYILLAISQPSNIPLCVHVLITLSCVDLVDFDKSSV